MHCSRSGIGKSATYKLFGCPVFEKDFFSIVHPASQQLRQSAENLRFYLPGGHGRPFWGQVTAQAAHQGRLCSLQDLSACGCDGAAFTAAAASTSATEDGAAQAGVQPPVTFIVNDDKLEQMTCGGGVYAGGPERRQHGLPEQPGQLAGG